MSLYNGATWPKSPEDMPKGEHFAILEFSSVYVEGDERSRTNPGHGYPGGYEDRVSYLVFPTQADWEKEIAERMTKPGTGSRRWVPMSSTVFEVTISTKVTTNVKTK